MHNHNIFCVDNLKFKDVSPAIIQKFQTLFVNGLSVTAALDKHKLDLQAEYGDNYFIAAADRSLCPDLQWCYRYGNINTTKYCIF